MSGGYEFIGGGFQASLPSGAVGKPDKRTDLIWRNTTSHRTRIGKLLIDSTKLDNPTLCVWGAGECTDLDLELFANHFSLTTLVDLDGEAMDQSLKQRELDSSGKFTTVGGLEISGVRELVQQYGTLSQSENGSTSVGDKSQLLGKIRTTANQYRLKPLKRYDVVASICLLSQLQYHLTEHVGVDDPAFSELLSQSRRRHLELLLEHTKPGGSAILITDLTSSEALPKLEQCGDLVSETIWKEIAAGNHFHGLNPAGINNEFDSNENLKSQLVRTRISRPWVWNATNRFYACIAYCMLKK